MPRASVIGVGMTPFGVHEATLPELFAEAAFPAFDDAGISAGEIDALYFGNAMGGQTENDTHLAPTLTSHVGLAGVPAQRFEDACATSSNAFKHAVEAVEAGLHDTVLVGGVERCTPETGLGTGAMTRIFASASHRQYEQPSGLTFPGVFALLTKRHMYEHGTTDEQLAHVAVKNHANGTLNPRAHFGRDVTTDDVLDSPTVADPFHLFDCCPFSDGAAAAIVTSADTEASFDGDGGPAAAEGRTSLEGEIPINPSGGLKAKGHPIGATGVAQIVELTEHLRGEANDRQVDDATKGVAHNLGGDAATTVVTVMEAGT